MTYSMDSQNNENSYRKAGIHAIAPYVGKLRPELASSLINEYSNQGDVIFDPFSGSGTVALEAWINKRIPLATDLNFYAFVLTQAKLFPFKSYSEALLACNCYNDAVELALNNDSGDPLYVPCWVRDFFHPDTLKEITAWVDVLLGNSEWFLLACLLGILHHQRPGFLSYPSSHGAPYLREKKYPRDKYPELYEYRPVYARIKKKIERAYVNFPSLDYSIARSGYLCDAVTLGEHVDIKGVITIITSPPYMKSLTYARDNRLRLWFLGEEDWRGLDKKISIGRSDFVSLMKNCFTSWSERQNYGRYCILVIGDMVFDKKNAISLPNLICELAEKSGYQVDSVLDYPINMDRKVEKKHSQIETEKICILRKG